MSLIPLAVSVFGLLLAGPSTGAGPAAASGVHKQTIDAIVSDIEALKANYPQLAGFSAERSARELTITHNFSTHAAPRTGGWTSGVPQPNPDGVWFRIDLHDPQSTLEMHTQPMGWKPRCFRGMRVSFLILQGKDTRSLEAPIWRILTKHGIGLCPAERSPSAGS